MKCLRGFIDFCIIIKDFNIRETTVLFCKLKIITQNICLTEKFINYIQNIYF